MLLAGSADAWEGFVGSADITDIANHVPRRAVLLTIAGLAAAITVDGCGDSSGTSFEDFAGRALGEWEFREVGGTGTLVMVVNEDGGNIHSWTDRSLLASSPNNDQPPPQVPFSWSTQRKTISTPTTWDPSEQATYDVSSSLEGDLLAGTATLRHEQTCGRHAEVDCDDFKYDFRLTLTESRAHITLTARRSSHMFSKGNRPLDLVGRKV
jgi:hypothetical protein